MDALKRRKFLDSLDREIKELEFEEKSKYCIWTCPECNRVLISGGFFSSLYFSDMHEDIGICFGDHAIHRQPKYEKETPYSPYEGLFHRRRKIDTHPRTVMDIQVTYLTRQEYIFMFH